MAGERGLQCGGRGFGIANFAHHDRLGILSQNRAKALREPKPARPIERHLRRFGERLLDGILERLAAGSGARGADPGPQRGGLERSGSFDNVLGRR